MAFMEQRDRQKPHEKKTRGTVFMISEFAPRLQAVFAL